MSHTLRPRVDPSSGSNPPAGAFESGPVPAGYESVAPGAGGEAWLGRTLAGRVRLLQHVADGTRGHLFRAERVLDDAAVAVKIARAGAHQTQSRFEECFAQEAAVAGSVRHPHALSVFHHGAAGSQAMFMELEWLDGYDLQTALERHGPLPQEQALLLASQTCRALKAAHQQGVVHGDLTPSSLFLHRTGQRAVVKVMDFGRQRLNTWSDDGASQVGLPTGWARYLAPEQISGDDFDARADVYALGAVLYQALSGELPFKDATGIGILIAHTTDRPQPLRQRPHTEALSRDLEDLVMCCLERDPAERFQSAGALLAAIDTLRRP